MWDNEATWGLPVCHGYDLNMVYYTIDISPQSCNLTTIVIEFGKFRYNRVPMGMYNSVYIFKYKLYDLLGDIEEVKTYIDNILLLGKGSFYQHIDQLKFIFNMMRTTGIKVNVTSWSFGLEGIPYLFKNVKMTVY